MLFRFSFFSLLNFADKVERIRRDPIWHPTKKDRSVRYTRVPNSKVVTIWFPLWRTTGT